MSDIFSQLTSILGSDVVKQVSGAIGASESNTSGAIGAAIPVLVGALANNAAKGNGAAALSGALDRDHDGSILDDIAGYVGKAQSGPGDGILGHILGQKRPKVEQQVAAKSGLDGAQMAQLMTTLAPIVMGAIGKQKREQGLDAGGLASMLGGAKQQAQAQAPSPDFLTSLLDSDGDGSYTDDLMEKGAGLLGSLFGSKK